jgi:hypothetical protein
MDETIDLKELDFHPGNHRSGSRKDVRRRRDDSILLTNLNPRHRSGSGWLKMRNNKHADARFD